jgi:pyruvate, orthophosphate dikinase
MNTSATTRNGRALCVIGETSVRDVTVDEVGAKAYNLMHMTEAGLPVPPGFVLNTQLCRAYHDAGGRLSEEIARLVAEGVRRIERATGLRFGAGRRPLLVAVRSGAAVSMPGMLDTILNVGLCDATLAGLLRATGDPVFVWDSYRRLIQSYGEVVEGCPAAPFAAVLNDATTQSGVSGVAELDVAGLKGVVRTLQDVYRSGAGHPFPQDPSTQLLGAVEAVLRSWNATRAVQYRSLQGLRDLAGTAVTVQAMVFGNLGVTSGSGVGFTRDPATGEDRLYVDFLLNAQGEDVVAGRYATTDPEPLIAALPPLADELQTVRRRLETIFGDAQDFEFTVEEGKLWLLQSRTAKRTPWAALRIACDLVDEQLIDPATAMQRLRDYDLDAITRTRLAAEDQHQPIGHGTPAGTGVTTGHIALSVDAASHYAKRGDPVVLVRDEASTQDIAGLAICRGLVTAGGARTSHAAVVARQLGVVCVVGCPGLSIDTERKRLTFSAHYLNEGDLMTVDGDRGLVFQGELELRLERPLDLIRRARAWQTTLTAQAGGRPSAN